MKVYESIDWLSITATMTHKPIYIQINNIFCDKLSPIYREAKGKMGYALASEYHDGRLLMYTPDDASQGIHAIYSGKCLASIEETYGNITRMDILSHHIKSEHKIRRIDIAVDLFDSGLSIGALHSLVESGDYISRVKSHTIVQGTQGQTLYIGSMKNRNKLLRIYDKAKERGMKDTDWKRIELSLYGKYAQVNARHIESGDFRSIIKGFCDFPNDPIWSIAFDGFTPKEVRAPDNISQNSTLAWISRQVIPAIARLKIQGYDMAKLIDEWSDQYIEHNYKDDID